MKYVKICPFGWKRKGASGVANPNTSRARQATQVIPAKSKHISFGDILGSGET